LQGDERLVALTRRGHQAAYEALVARYQSRLLSFCRHMLSSREDAEDVLQEVFAAAFNALMADTRAINVRPWLYRIARNRCLNHLRKQTAIGVDSMDVHLADHGTTTADRVHDREEFRQLVADVQTLPETQRTALLLREIDALSYEQIAEAMETTVPSVKSLLVRARVSLAEASESRKLTCAEVRDELGEWAEGLRQISPPVRRHVRACTRCAGFKKQLSQTNRALAAVFPLGPLLLLKKFILAQGAGGAAAAGASAAGAGASAAGGAAAGSALSAGVTAIATKTAAGLAAAAIVTAGAVEVDNVQRHHAKRTVAAAVAAAPQSAVAATPKVVRSVPQAAPAPAPKQAGAPGNADDAVQHTLKKAAADQAPASAALPGSAALPAALAPTGGAETPAPGTPPQQLSDSAALPPQPSPAQAQFVPGTPPPAPIVPTPAPIDQPAAPASSPAATTPASEPSPSQAPQPTTTAPPATTTPPTTTTPPPATTQPATTTPPASSTPASPAPSSTTPADQPPPSSTPAPVTP
jgi:RNA polymerase sigma factor (sigma-70 family)